MGSAPLGRNQSLHRAVGVRRSSPRTFSRGVNTPQSIAVRCRLAKPDDGCANGPAAPASGPSLGLSPAPGLSPSPGASTHHSPPLRAAYRYALPMVRHPQPRAPQAGPLPAQPSSALPEPVRGAAELPRGCCQQEAGSARQGCQPEMALRFHQTRQRHAEPKTGCLTITEAGALACAARPNGRQGRGQPAVTDGRHEKSPETFMGPTPSP
jgi:hypothetical protein